MLFEVPVIVRTPCLLLRNTFLLFVLGADATQFRFLTTTLNIMFRYQIACTVRVLPFFLRSTVLAESVIRMVHHFKTKKNPPSYYNHKENRVGCSWLLALISNQKCYPTEQKHFLQVATLPWPFRFILPLTLKVDNVFRKYYFFKCNSYDKYTISYYRWCSISYQIYHRSDQKWASEDSYKQQLYHQ